MATRRRQCPDVGILITRVTGSDLTGWIHAPNSAD